MKKEEEFYIRSDISFKKQFEVDVYSYYGSCAVSKRLRTLPYPYIKISFEI